MQGFTGRPGPSGAVPSRLLRQDDAGAGASSGHGLHKAQDRRAGIGNPPLDLLSSPVSAPPPEPHAPSDSPDDADVPLWMQRVSIVVFVIFCIELGMVLAVIPWRPEWTNNSLIEGYPGLRAFMEQNFVRGAVTGLGLVNIWIGVWEAVRYRESRRR